jgi:hypothetical protein
VRSDLRDGVLAGNQRQQRFLHGAAQVLAALTQAAHAPQQRRVVVEQPLEDRTRVMQVNPQLWVCLQQLEDRTVRTVHRAAHAVLEVAARLMVVKYQCDLQDLPFLLSTLVT